MPRRPPEERLQDLETKRAQITARIDRERARLRTEERKRDTRRKIIAGAIALEHAQKDPAFAQELQGLLSRYVKPQDKALFDLAPK